MIKSKQLAKAIFELAEEKTENLDAKFFDFIEKRNLYLEKIISKRILFSKKYF